jgi:hypothetical protein
MNGVTCGQCICPTPIPTQTPSMDFCTAINSTHAVCNLGLGHMPSMADVFLFGLCVGVFGLIFFAICYKLFKQG